MNLGGKNKVEYLEGNYDSNGDTDFFIKYLGEKLVSYEENINSSYVNIKTILNKLEEEFPQIDVMSFSEFFLICEEYYNLLQISKSCLKRLDETNNDNSKLITKIQNLKLKKTVVEGHNDNMIENNKYKEELIKKLEEDIQALSKDYIDLCSKFNKSNFDIKEQENVTKITNNQLLEVRLLSEEKANLQREHLMLMKNIDKLENDIKSKYISKTEYEKTVLKLVSEKNGYHSKVKISELNLERTKRELQHIKVDNVDLKKELEKSEKRIIEMTQSDKRRSSEVYSHFENKATPLNFVLCEEEEDYERKVTKKIKRESTTEVKEFAIDSTKSLTSEVMHKKQIKQNSQISHPLSSSRSKTSTERHQMQIIKEMDEGRKSELEEGTLFKDTKQNNYLNTFDYSSEEDTKEKKPKQFDLKLTSNEIVHRMSNNDFKGVKNLTPSNEQINKLDSTKPSNERQSKVFTILKHSDNYDDQLYKDFFMLTYQSLKLNRENIEPFLYLNAEKLYKSTTDNCLPFHKFYKFIKAEINTLGRKLESKNKYNKTKFDSVVNFISSRLF